MIGKLQYMGRFHLRPARLPGEVIRNCKIHFPKLYRCGDKKYICIHLKPTFDFACENDLETKIAGRMSGNDFGLIDGGKKLFKMFPTTTFTFGDAI